MDSTVAVRYSTVKEEGVGRGIARWPLQQWWTGVVGHWVIVFIIVTINNLKYMTYDMI